MELAGKFDRYEDAEIGDADYASILTGHERRLQVRAYEYWLSLLNGRPCPSVQDLDAQAIADFSSNSVLLDFSQGIENPRVTYLGRALREEAGLLYGIRTVADVPPRSLLSRLTDHCLQALANKTPVGFEAEFVNHHKMPTMYRGLLMPLSSDGGDTIDYVYGVINWKHPASDAESFELEQELAAVLPEPSSEPEPEVTGHGLWDWLAAARMSAEEAGRCDSRAHGALYDAIGRAYDFALAADEQPEAFAEMLADEGLTVQARAPMTPVVKLVFGADYDKTRITEYAAALSYAQREGLEKGALAGFLGAFEGGLKAIVKAERAFRAPVAKPDRAEKARAKLRVAPAKAVIEFDAGESEFVLILARRGDAGRVDLLGTIDDAKLLDAAVRKVA